MKEELSLLTELIKLAKCDQIFKNEEYKFLLTIAEQLGVSKIEFDSLFHDKIEFTPPKNEFDRILQFHRLVLLMNIDKDSSEKEIAFVLNLGVRMGLNTLATKKVLDVMNNYPNKLVPPDVLMGIFKEHYN